MIKQHIILIFSLVMLAVLLSCSKNSPDPDPGSTTPPSVEKINILDKISDPVFRSMIAHNLDTYDRDKDGRLSEDEAAQITDLDLNNWGKETKIASLQGIEFFTYLRKLDFGWNKLSAVDLSKNTKLEILYCMYNSDLTTLDLSKNTDLETIYCHHMGLETLTVNSDRLFELYAQDNRLTSMTFLSESKIKTLYCQNNLLTRIAIPNGTAMEVMDCSNNRLTVLDLTPYKWIRHLNCSKNKLADLDLSKSRYVVEVVCSDNLLGSINLDHCAELLALTCEHNKLLSLDLTAIDFLMLLKAKDNPSLKEVYVRPGFQRPEGMDFEMPDQTKLIEKSKVL